MGRGVFVGPFAIVAILVLGPLVGLVSVPVSALHGVPAGPGWGTAAPVLFRSITETDTIEPDVDVDAGGNATKPDVDVDAGGNATVVWLQSSGGRYEVLGTHLTEFQYRGRIEPIATGLGYPWPPRVAMNPQGEAIAAWSEWVGASGRVFASVLLDVQDVPGNRNWGPWGPAVTIGSEPRHTHPPQVAIDDRGNAIVVWGRQLSEEVDYAILANRFNSTTQRWGDPVVLGVEDSQPAQLAMDASGNAIAMWSQSGTIRASRFDERTEQWGAAVALGHGGRGEIAMNARGDAIVLWPSGNLVASRFDQATGSWGTAIPIENGVRRINSLDLGMDASGNALAIWTKTYPGVETQVARFDAGANSWGRATTLATNNANGSVELDVDARGFAIAIWTQWDGLRWGLLGSRFSPHTGWGEAVEIGVEVGDARSPRIAMDAAGNATLVWSQWDGDRYQIFRNRFVSDQTTPSLSLKSPTDGSIVLASAVTVSGVTDPEARIMINGLAVPVSPNDGSFSAAVGLSDGVNGITVVATNTAGNAATVSLRVTSVSLALMLQAALIASLLALILIYLQRSAGRRSSSGNRRRRKSFGIPGMTTLSRRLRREPLGSAALPKAHKVRVWSAPPRGSPFHLTSKERILLHLAEFAEHRVLKEVPPDLTQSGISSMAVVDLRHFAQYVRPLLKEGLVFEGTSYVRGGLQRQKVYGVTEKGEQMAVGIRDRLLSTPVTVQDAEGAREAPLAEVYAEIAESRSLLDVVREVIENGFMDGRS